MPSGIQRQNAKFSIQQWLQRSLKVKSALALNQKFKVTRSDCVESFILVSKSAHKALFWPYACRSTIQVLALVPALRAALSQQINL